MRVLVQRVRYARVCVGGKCTGAIDRGLLLLTGITHGDSERELAWMSRRVAHLRVFQDEEGRFDRSLLDIAGGALVVSQFTLYGDCRKGRRPSFTAAARSEFARPLIDRFTQLLREQGVTPVECGRFGARMEVELLNDGPVTLLLEAPPEPSSAGETS